MDVLTQGLAGAVMAQAAAQADEKRLATVTGFAAGLLADADVLIRSGSDPLLNIEFHRHFTHALIFIPVGAAAAALMLWPLLRRRLSARRLYGYCLAGYSMSGILDACTSYGTHLFWPFTEERVSLNIISIVDPVFTLILLTALALGLRYKDLRAARTGLLCCLAYLTLGFVQLQRAQDIAAGLMAGRGHTPEQQVVKPTVGNLLLWRSVYIYNDRIYVDAVRAGIFGSSEIFPGESVQRFSMHALPWLDNGTTLYRDIQRFMNFSDGFVGYDPAHAYSLGDIRYSMLPDSARPLWGIVFDPGQPQQHADYLFYRENTPAIRQAFLDMLF